jgi:hypothetical protein
VDVENDEIRQVFVDRAKRRPPVDHMNRFETGQSQNASIQLRERHIVFHE